MRVLAYVVMLTIFSFPAWATSPAGIMSKALENYTSVFSEVEYSKVTTSDWGAKPRYCTSWVRRNTDGENELMFVINRSDDLRSKPDGAIIKSENGTFIPPVVFQKRRNIREKNSGFDEKSNGTELNYFDLARMTGEKAEDLELSFWNTSLDSNMKTKAKYFVRVIPRSTQTGDYAYRVFHIGEVDGMPVVLVIEYFDNSGQIVKLQLNSDFKKLQINQKTIVREKTRRFITDDGETTVVVTCRIFNASFGALNKDALERGQP